MCTAVIITTYLRYGVHDVGRQGLMRTTVTRHMPSATRQRRDREGSKGRKKKKRGRGWAGLVVEMQCIIKPSPADPAPAFGVCEQRAA